MYNLVLKKTGPQSFSLDDLIKLVIGRSLTKDYKAFLLQYNGGIPARSCYVTFYDTVQERENSSDINNFYGIRVPQRIGCFPDDYYMDIRSALLLREGRFPSHMIPIAGDSCGNEYLLSLQNPDRGKVYFWDHEAEGPDDEPPGYGNLSLIAYSFTEFIEKIKYEDEDPLT